MTKRWYYQMLMEEFGPVTAEQLSALIEEGTVSDTDLVRAEHSDQWFAASQWSPNHVADESTDKGEFEEISDLSELAFEFENAGAATRTRTSAAPSSEISQPVAAAAAPLPGEEETEPAIYYYQSFGQTLGPLPLSSLVSLAEAGAISETDQIRVGESNAWKPASTVEELSITFMTVDNTFEQSPQLSLTTQKRLGEQATAVALAPEKPAAVDVQQPSDAAGASAPTTENQLTEKSSDSQSEIDTRGRKGSGKGKVTRKEAAKRREDALLEDIFDDVFSEEAPAPPRPSMAASAAMMSPSPVTSAPTPMAAPSAPVSPMSTPPAFMNNSAASMSRPTLAPMPRSSSSSSSSSMPLLKIGGIVVLVIAVLAVGYFGFSGMTGPPISIYVTKIKMAAEDLKKMGDKPTEIQWLSFGAKKTEFTSMQNIILESNASGERIDKCKLAITMYLRAASTRFKDTKDVQKAAEDFLKAAEKIE